MEEKRMMIEDVLNERTIDLTEPSFADKEELFDHMAGMFLKAEVIDDKDDFKRGLYKREEEGSTYIGNNIAIPHGIAKTVKQPAIALCRCRPFFYESLDDGGEVSLALMFALPDDFDHNYYLLILSSFSRLLMEETVVEHLMNDQDPQEILSFLNKSLEEITA